MTVKDIIDKERWTKATIDNCRLTPFNWRYLHNVSLDRVKRQISAHIAELEAQLPKVVTPVFMEEVGVHRCTCLNPLPDKEWEYCHSCGAKLNWEEA